MSATTPPRDPETKAEWRRRALKAEAHARLLEQALDGREAIDRRLFAQTASASVALALIHEALDWYQAAHKDPR